MEGNHSPKETLSDNASSYNNTPSYNNKKHEDHGVSPGSKDSVITEMKMLPVNRKLSFSMDKYVVNIFKIFL